MDNPSADWRQRESGDYRFTTILDTRSRVVADTTDMSRDNVASYCGVHADQHALRASSEKLTSICLLYRAR